MAHLQDKFPQHEFSLIMGEDNLKSFHKWKNYEFILENHDIYVYPRITAELDINHKEELTKPNSIHTNNPKIHRIDAPVVEISSTFIRENIKNNKNVRPLLPEKVWEYIDHNNLYKDFNRKNLWYFEKTKALPFRRAFNVPGAGSK